MLRLFARAAVAGEARCLASLCLPATALQPTCLATAGSGGGGALLGPSSQLPAAASLLHWRGSPAQGFSTAAAVQAALGAGQQLGAGAPSGPAADQPAPAKQVLYKGRGIRLFRLLVRMKIFQLTGVAALAIPITTFLSQGEVSAMQAVIASALLVGSGVASTALWYYSRRYVGELAVLRDGAGQPTAARLSVLDFWGNREDNDVDLRAMVPPLQGVLPQVRDVMLGEPLIPVDVEGDRQYFLSLRYGHVLDRPQLLALLEGRLAQQLGPEQAGAPNQGSSGGAMP